MEPTAMLGASSDDEDWDDCDRPIPRTKARRGPSRRQIHQFTNVDGIKSGLVKALGNENNVQRSKDALNLDTIIQLPPPTITPFEPGEEKVLPPSLLLASRNKIPYEQLLSTQKSVNFNLPYFFYGAQVYPAVLRGTTNTRKSLEDIIQTMTPALVYGIKRHALRGHTWPGVVCTGNQADLLSGMLAFGISDAARKWLDDFQGGSSELRTMRADFVLKDGRTCSIDCGVYVTKELPSLTLLPHSEKIWRVSDLMRDPWHLRNLSTSMAEEEYLNSKLQRN
ncbi:uncharacterized protein PV09_00115 [Verruconis gallopava]|uniref:Gamma-glutamylcyclotransferase AIG2-like domain-containing protein n=1 Tax=Verruconis gallopava TaxID=253628 RepID=A0A0D2BCQ9_9PEZI|nr:uncharacterized protein PV09_00115 [Verruconis gallopava]KIW09184.1 hypothetical protein PV09_00115 [Verruconis gallopava]